jgi:hypothetical protein
MSIDSKGIFEAMQSMGQETGLFNTVLTHEPKSPPVLDGRPTLALFAGMVTPIQSSGLNSVCLRWQVNGRVYMNGFSEPADAIDPEVVSATSLYIAALAGGFTLGGLIRCIDFYGSDGEPLKAESGYLEMDKKIYRCMELEIPLLINDVWELVP